MMTTSPQPPTARIYRFPMRAGTPAKPRDPARQTDTSWTAPRPRTDFGSGWYHDAAIHETDRSRSH